MTVGGGDPITALAIALGVLAGLALLMGWRRSRAAQAGSERIELVTSRYLGGKRVLTLVDVEGERLLLALSGNGVRLVARLGSRARSAARAPSSPPRVESAEGEASAQAPLPLGSGALR